MQYIGSALRGDAENIRRQEFEARRILPTLDPYARRMAEEAMIREVRANRARQARRVSR